MAKFKVRRDSRFTKTPIFTQNGDRFFGTWRAINFTPSETDDFLTVREHHLGRLEDIAFKFYDNPALWWVIAQANGISDQFNDMVEGDTLRIPARGIVFSALFA